MLVLTRKLHESIKIGPEIEIHINRLDNGRVRVAIDAPKHIAIVRSELVDRDRPKAA